MAMLNLFGRKNRIKKQKRKIARTVQQSIPIDAIYKDGIFRTGRLFSKSWKFSDINYAVASDDDQLQMFLAHSAILNGLPTDAMAEITIYNRQLHNKVFEQITTPSDNPNYRKYTKELNGILCDKMSESNNIVHEKYITVATEKKNIEEARTFFTRVGNDLTADYAKISSKIAELGYKDRLRIFNDFFKTGENEEFDFDLKKAMAKGADFKDYIAPDSLEFKKDYIKIGDKYARTVFLKEYPSFLKDSMISELTDFSRSMMLSITIQPIPTDDAIKTVAKALKDTLGEKADIFRIGGDEFVCISESNVLPYISQFKDTVSFIDREKLYKLAVSIGYSKYHEKYTKSIDDIICRADEKMYKAKKDKK